VANLAAAFAARGNRVLVLDGDLRRPRLDKVFAVRNGRGLADVLSEEPQLPRIVEAVAVDTSIERLSVVPSGAIPEEPSELLASPTMERVLRESRTVADVVLIDTAPILTTSDAIGLLSQVDAVLLVARAGRTSGPVATRTAELLRRIDAPVAGVVLNAASEIALPGRYYGYYAKRTRATRTGNPRLARQPEKTQTERW
jgi:capsular exopolysaccharide synthesis family protein